MYVQGQAPFLISMFKIWQTLDASEMSKKRKIVCEATNNEFQKGVHIVKIKAHQKM